MKVYYAPVLQRLYRRQIQQTLVRRPPLHRMVPSLQR